MTEVFSQEWYEARRNRKLPYTPDDNPGATYAAVGSALSCWERLEQTFADIYAIMKGNSGSLDEMLVYADAARTFSQRMIEMKAVSAQYFVGCPDQSLEGQFSLLVARTSRLANKRHRIAHGIVMPRAIGWTPDGEFGSDYRLVPPFYAMHRLSAPERMFYYGSTEINAIAVEFDEVTSAIRTFRDLL